MRHDQSIFANSFASSNSAQVCSQKFCSYNFMLNEAPKNNDVMRRAIIVLNKAPYSNDATRIGSNVRLTAMGIQKFSIWPLYSHASCRKADLPDTRDNNTIPIKVRADI